VENQNHLSDEELLLLADGELSSARMASSRVHMSACWSCRTRMRELEAGIADFTNAYRAMGESVPPSEGPRALLKARLAEASHTPRQPFPLEWRLLAGASGVLAIALLAIFGSRLLSTRRSALYPAITASSTPRVSLTPGAVRSVSNAELCRAAAVDDPGVPDSLRKQVFEEYGMREARADAFEIDYLVTPELGGERDLRNLWPEPYETVVWNARVKDALERRLHEMVCSGQIDLATAQRDISGNWIAAYKKYFQRNTP
jgi:hypothetical protein